MTSSDRGSKPRRSRATGVIRVIVSVVILAIVLRYVSTGEVLDRMRATSPALWALVFFGFLVGHAFAAAKWRWMIGGGVSYPRAVRAHFAGLAANLALPGVAGGDLVRAGLVMRGSNRKTALAVGSLADRLIDTAALLVIAAIGALWLGARAGVDPTALGLIAASVIGGGVACVVFIKPIAGVLRRVAPQGKAGVIIRDVADAAIEMASRRGALIGCALLSIAIQSAFALMNGAIAQNLGVGTSYAAWVFAWPLAKLVATLPVSFGGLGVREASLAGLMAPFGYPAAGVVAASLVWQTILYAAGAVGAAMQLVGRAGAPITPEASHG